MRVHQHLVVSALVLAGFFTLGTFRAHPATAPTQKAEWLPLCGKCQTPTVFSKSGIGTANAIAKARVTYQDAKQYCEQWSIEDHPNCDRQAKETLQEENGKIYTATADCVHGKMTDANGENFTYADLWPKSDRYLAGKTRWRGALGPMRTPGKLSGKMGRRMPIWSLPLHIFSVPTELVRYGSNSAQAATNGKQLKGAPDINGNNNPNEEKEDDDETPEACIGFDDGWRHSCTGTFGTKRLAEDETGCEAGRAEYTGTTA